MIYSRLCSLIICLYFTKAYEIDTMFDNREWRPISNMEAFKILGINTPSTNAVKTVWNPTENFPEENVNVFKNDVLRLVKPHQVYGEFKIKRKEYSNRMVERSIKAPNNYQRITRKCVSIDCVETSVEEISKIRNKIDNTTEEKSLRKAKKITDDKIGLNVIDKIKEPVDLKTESTNEVIEKSKHSYEVTENTEAKDLLNAEQVHVKAHTGYEYKPPQLTLNKSKSNLTDAFLNILSKYNINSEDELRNYDLSRRSNAANSLKADLPFIPLPVSSQSFNYLPINPLLAVLLSNYGYYLPGAYGMRNNYKNLYGYLASNNIHNNKPFGGYKIYSDTDSSNK